jgi:hypothetical protein
MGAFVGPVVVFVLQGIVNARFAEGDPLTEMVALQDEFEVFSEDHDLKSSAALLGLAPDFEPQRQNWLNFLDSLHSVESPAEGVSGHDFIRQVLQDNLEGEAPQPVFFDYHDAAEHEKVRLNQSGTLAVSAVNYLVVSVPTQSAGAALRGAAKQRRAARGPSRGAPGTTGAGAGKTAGKPGGKVAKKASK